MGIIASLAGTISILFNFITLAEKLYVSIVEGLKRAGVEHTHKVVKGAVIIWNDSKDRLLAVPHQAQFHIVAVGDADDLREDKGGQAYSGLN